METNILVKDFLDSVEVNKDIKTINCRDDLLGKILIEDENNLSGMGLKVYRTLQTLCKMIDYTLDERCTIIKYEKRVDFKQPGKYAGHDVIFVGDSGLSVEAYINSMDRSNRVKLQFLLRDFNITEDELLSDMKYYIRESYTTRKE